MLPSSRDRGRVARLLDTTAPTAHAPVLDTTARTAHARAVTGHEPERPLARDTRVRLARRAGIALLALLTLDLLLLASGQPGAPLAGAGIVVVAALVGALLVERRAVEQAAARIATNEATLTRMLRGLSRSTSADATVDAIVDELREASGADHVVVARLKPAERVIEATLVSSSVAVPLSVTRFPASDLEPAAVLSVRAWDRGVPSAREAPPAAGVPSAREAPAAAGVPSARGAQSVREEQLAREAPPSRGAPSVHDVAPARGTVRTRRPAVLLSDADPGVAASAPDEELRPGSTMYAVERITDRVSRAYGLRHILAEPLVVGGQVVGALMLSRRTDAGWAVQSRQILAAAAQDLSAALERAYAHEEARTRAATDALTGIPNRAYFEELVELLGRGGRRANDALGILMLDLDHFKTLNDRYGHLVGDEVLRGVGRVLRGTVRADDVPARYGGEEFVVVLRRATEETALEIAERVRQSVRALDLAELKIDAPVTVSVGVAVGVTSARSLVERADAALYRAKRRGRDCVEVG
jgi:diguanylate cyclase (GGDEF)-like protein